ncbi:MAG: DUF6565 domain-containing protein [Flavobacterium sp.]
MKNLKKYIGLAALAVIVSSCKDEKQEMAKQKVDHFKMYVDSVSEVATEKTAEDWEMIQQHYDKTKMEAESSLTNLENKMGMDSIINNADSKFEEYKAKVVSKKQEVSSGNFRNNFFTEKIGTDLSFSWVNKDNIANVYSNFVATAEKNKDTYSREDWDEIKMLYEALDTRKNTVEKEGLSSKDNIKIAGLKIKFATMYKVNRMTAKSKENMEAKE